MGYAMQAPLTHSTQLRQQAVHTCVSASMDAAADAAYGSLLGACVGDAAGAVLEFIYRMPTEAEVRSLAACARHSLTAQ